MSERKTHILQTVRRRRAGIAQRPRLVTRGKIRSKSVVHVAVREPNPEISRKCASRTICQFPRVFSRGYFVLVPKNNQRLVVVLFGEIARDGALFFCLELKIDCLRRRDTRLPVLKNFNLVAKSFETFRL